MSAVIRIYVEDIAAKLIRFNQIRVYRDDAPSGSFLPLAGTIQLLEGQEEYTLVDVDGTPLHWYRHQYHNSDTDVQSDYSPPYAVGGSSLLTARLAVARECGAAFYGAAGADSTVGLLHDELLRDQGVDDNFLQGGWIYRPNALVDTDRVRRIAPNGFDPSAGTLSVVREWDEQPAEDEHYEVFALVPPIYQPGTTYNWDQAVRDGLQEIWYLDRLNLGEGSGNAHGYEDFSLAHHLGQIERDAVRRVLVARTEDSNDFEQDWSKGGKRWEMVEDGPESWAVRLRPPPTAAQTVYVEVQRRPDPVYRDDDLIRGADEVLVGKAGAFRAFAFLNRQPTTVGQYEREAALAREEWLRVYQKPPDIVIGA